MTIAIGQRVELSKDVEHYQIGIFRAGEKGMVKAVHDYMIEVLLDCHHESLDEWENILQIHDGSELNGDEEKPEAYLRVVEA